MPFFLLPPLAAALAVAAVYVNGFTDAPNAIAAAVGSGALSYRVASLLAALMNWAGLLLSAALFPAVARTMGQLAPFRCDTLQGLAAFIGVLGSVALFATGAWWLGIPTSESHGLMGALAGAALALGQRPQAAGVAKAVGGLVFSMVVGALLGDVCMRLVREGRCTPSALRRGQAASCGLMAFAHGAQDGQKFLAVLALGMGGGRATPGLAALCAGVMAAGTLLGGQRIIQKLTGRMVQADLEMGLASDLAAVACLLGACLWGLPVSTTQTRACSLWGAAGAAGVDWRVAGQLCLAWALTLPGCAALAWLLTRLLVAAWGGAAL